MSGTNAVISYRDGRPDERRSYRHRAMAMLRAQYPTMVTLERRGRIVVWASASDMADDLGAEAGEQHALAVVTVTGERTYQVWP